MQRSIFGVFTAFLAVICILCALPALRKKTIWIGSSFVFKCLYKYSQYHSCRVWYLILI